MPHAAASATAVDAGDPVDVASIGRSFWGGRNTGAEGACCGETGQIRGGNYISFSGMRITTFFT